MPGIGCGGIKICLPRSASGRWKMIPAFRRLPPGQQQVLRQRLQHFSSLPREQQDRMLDRMDRWAHLTPQQKEQARQIHNRMQQLPADRQRMVRTAIGDLRAMPPDQRDQIIDSAPLQECVLAGGARHHARRHPAAACSAGEWQTGRSPGAGAVRQERRSSFVVRRWQISTASAIGERLTTSGQQLIQWKSCETVSAFVTNSGSTRSAFTEITLS